MTPSGLRSYLREHRQASLSDLTIHFHSSAEAVQAAMAGWIAKGVAEISTVEEGCGSSCCRCDMAKVTIYRWLEKSALVVES